VNVGRGVLVFLGVFEGLGVTVGTGVFVGAGTGVLDGGMFGVSVGIGIGVGVGGVPMTVGVGVNVSVGFGLEVGVRVLVGVELGVNDGLPGRLVIVNEIKVFVGVGVLLGPVIGITNAGVALSHGTGEAKKNKGGCVGVKKSLANAS